MLDPARPDNAPNPHTFVNNGSRNYFEAQAVWPTGSFMSSIPHFSDVVQVREAVAEWVRAFIIFLAPLSFECSWTEASFVQDFGEGHSSCEGSSFLEGQRTNARNFESWQRRCSSDSLIRGGSNRLGLINQHKYENAILPCESSYQSSVLKVHSSFDALESNHQ